MLLKAYRLWLISSFILSFNGIYLGIDLYKSIVHCPVMHHLFYNANPTFIFLLRFFSCFFVAALEVANSQLIPLLWRERLASFTFEREKYVTWHQTFLLNAALKS